MWIAVTHLSHVVWDISDYRWHEDLVSISSKETKNYETYTKYHFTHLIDLMVWRKTVFEQRKVLQV